MIQPPVGAMFEFKILTDFVPLLHLVSAVSLGFKLHSLQIPAARGANAILSSGTSKSPLGYVTAIGLYYSVLLSRAAYY